MNKSHVNSYVVYYILYIDMDKLHAASWMLYIDMNIS